MLRVVADLGNSRLKWGRLDARGEVEESLALPPDDPHAWATAWGRWASPGEGSSWAVASVNPPAADRLAGFLGETGANRVRWFRSAADVPVRHGLERPGTAGADRALAVAGALAVQPEGGPGLVVLCGTAVTVERIDAGGVWQGGAIAGGLGLMARALHVHTAQLPLVVPKGAPAAWGNATVPAIEAGVFWGVVGGVRELIARQSEGLGGEPWLVWTGGDAEALAAAVAHAGSRVVPDLVLRGLAGLAFVGGAADGR